MTISLVTLLAMIDPDHFIDFLCES